MFYLVLVVCLWVLGTLALIWLAEKLFEWMDNSPEPNERQLKRIIRDSELEEAYWQLYAHLGRQPTTSEIWEFSPPRL